MQRTCTMPECGKTHRAKGFCSTHYNQLCLKAERHAKVSVACSQCGKACIKDRGRDKRYEGLFCSLACRDADRVRRAELRKLPVLYVGAIVRQAPRTPGSPPPRLWTAGRCAHCRTHFVERQPGARFCSPHCTRVYWRRELKKTSGVSDSVRAHVFVRDGWRCQICKRAIRRDLLAPHPLSPSIDHIIPQSQGGTHDTANLRAAHFLCNSTRGDRGGYEQLALLG